MSSGILLINLGTPKSTKWLDVARYLHEFLSDPRVIDAPWLIRKILVSIIVLFRSAKSAQAYKKIWLAQGSPLMVNSQALATQLQENLGKDYIVDLAMRYGKPSIQSTLANLLKQRLATLIVIPLFPQYASASTGSAIAKFLQQISHYQVIPELKIINNWHDHPRYIAALATSIKRQYAADEHLIFSFHGLPVRQNILACTNSCDKNCQCYKAQCIKTACLVAKKLGLHENSWSLAFQSRLGKIEWLKPYLDQHLLELYTQGQRKLCVISPGFVADCLETSEELGIQLKNLWLKIGGLSFKLLPALNAEYADILPLIINEEVYARQLIYIHE